MVISIAQYEGSLNFKGKKGYQNVCYLFTAFRTKPIQIDITMAYLEFYFSDGLA